MTLSLSKMMILTPILSFDSRSFKIVMFTMFRTGHKLEILNPVIRSVMILMMNMLSRREISFKILLYNPSMFQHIAMTVSIWMIWFAYENIALNVWKSSALPMWILFNRYFGTSFKMTCITMTSDKSCRLVLMIVPASHLETAAAFAIPLRIQCLFMFARAHISYLFTMISFSPMPLSESYRPLAMIIETFNFEATAAFAQHYCRQMEVSSIF